MAQFLLLFFSWILDIYKICNLIHKFHKFCNHALNNVFKWKRFDWCFQLHCDASSLFWLLCVSISRMWDPLARYRLHAMRHTRRATRYVLHVTRYTLHAVGDFRYTSGSHVAKFILYSHRENHHNTPKEREGKRESVNFKFYFFCKYR